MPISLVKSSYMVNYVKSHKERPQLKLLSWQELALQSLKKIFLQWALKGYLSINQFFIENNFQKLPFGAKSFSPSPVLNSLSALWGQKVCTKKCCTRHFWPPFCYLSRPNQTLVTLVFILWRFKASADPMPFVSVYKKDCSQQQAAQTQPGHPNSVRCLPVVRRHFRSPSRFTSHPEA